MFRELSLCCPLIGKMETKAVREQKEIDYGYMQGSICGYSGRLAIR